ncbi:hypothetical protein THIOSC13_100001 [uncultured Thiomicrorhabdus sp.]
MSTSTSARVRIGVVVIFQLSASMMMLFVRSANVMLTKLTMVFIFVASMA